MQKKTLQIIAGALTGIFTLSAGIPASAADEHPGETGDFYVRGNNTHHPNDAILQQSRDRFSTLAELAKGDYTRDLNALENRFTALQPRKNPVIFLDPAVYDSARALGFDQQQALTEALKNRGLPAVADDLGKEMAQSAELSAPKAFNIGDRFCVIQPAHISSDINITNATRETKISFINRHEGWHCLDSAYSDYSWASGLSMQTATPDHIARSMLQAMKQEAFADLGATGDMIREGRPVGLIDQIADWRQNNDDLEHTSSQALLALKTRIEQMGLGRFRAMDDAAIRDLYIDITDNNVPTPTAMRHMIRYLHSTPLQRLGLGLKSIIDPELREALHFLTRATAPIRKKSAPQSDADRLILKNYDATQALKERASALGDPMTPENVVLAHTQLQSELLQMIRKNPGAECYASMSASLKGAFKHATAEIDYTAIKKPRPVSPAGP